MQIENHNGSLERTIAIGMIVDTAILGKIAPRFDEDCFKSKYAATLGRWCVDFYNKYGKAPGKSIQPIFQSWADNGRDEDTFKILNKLLGSLSDEYETLEKESNSQWVIDQAGEYFTKIKVRKLAESIEGDVLGGKTQDALKKINAFGRVDLGANTFIDVLRDEAAIKDAIESKAESIVQYKAAAGEFFGDALERDGFVALWGFEKSGKTWFLLDIAWRAMLQGRKVAFFEIGDLSQRQIMRRFISRAAKRPIKAVNVPYPVEIYREPNDEIATVKHEIREFDAPIIWEEAIEKTRALIKSFDSQESLLRLLCCPTSTLTVHALKAMLQAEARAGWVPDVVIVDYMDILAPPYGVLDTQEQTNSNWMQMRAISQMFHCLVVAATQSNAKSYKTKLMGKEHFSRDKRKLAHVTATYGINQTIEEKELGLYRINPIVVREDMFVETKYVSIASCLGIANPLVCSTW